MQKLSKNVSLILKALELYPQGLFAWQIQEKVKITSKQNTRRYLIRLLGKQLIQKRGKLYFCIQTPGMASVGVSKEFTQTLKSEKPEKLQRLHALSIKAGLFRTSWGRAEAILSNKKIAFHKAAGQLNLNWQGIALKITSKSIIAYPKEVVAPLHTEGQEMISRAMLDVMDVLEHFIARTGFRCLRDADSTLLLKLSYWENGYVDNKLAEEATKEQSKIILAYDRETGHARIWADSSLDPFKELETNSTHADAELRRFFQAIEDGELHPYDDLTSMKHIGSMMNQFISTQHFKDQQTSQLINHILMEPKGKEKRNWKAG